MEEQNMYHLRLKGMHYEMGVKRGKLFQRSGITFPLQLDDFQLAHGMKKASMCRFGCYKKQG